MGLDIDKIDASKWLDDLLNDTPNDKAQTVNSLGEMKDRAIAAKIADVENFNLSVNARLRRRVPDRLEPVDVAAILLHLFVFKSVTSAKTPGAGTLSIYVPETTDIWTRIIQGSAKGIYVEDTKFFKYLVTRLSIVKTRDVAEVLDLLSTYAPVAASTREIHIFPVNNGLFNQKTGLLEPFTPDYIFTKKISVDYDPAAVNKIIVNPDGTTWDVESWLKELSVSEDVNTLFWQVIAASIQPNRGMNKSIWFYSESGNNGKGTVGQLIKNLLGAGNYSSLNVNDFKHEFKKVALLTAVANIADENNVGEYIDAVTDYKLSVTGDDIFINIKNKQPVPFQFLGLNIQMMNGLPKTQDKTDSFYRRLLIVPFIKSFTNNGERGYIKTDYINRKEVLEYVLFKALTLPFFESFIVSAESVTVLEQYKEKNNPVFDFWNELKEEFVWDLLPSNFLFDMFQKWFEYSNPSGKSINKRAFTEQLGPIIEADGDWENLMASTINGVPNNGVSGPKYMKDDEPLISQYGLGKITKGTRPSEWVNTAYSGTNVQKYRDFTRKKHYRGLKRL